MATDPAPALQAERTGLTWVRTLVVVAGTWGLVAFHAVEGHGWTVFGFCAAGIAVLVLVTAGWIGTHRGRRASRAMAAGEPVTLPVALLALAAASVVVAVVALASLLPS